jgi:hypothetical protein
MDRAEIYVGLPDSPLPTALPSGWTVVRDGDPLTVAGPELDLNVTFLGRPLRACSNLAKRRRLPHRVRILGERSGG